MTGEDHDERTDAPPVDPDSAVKLRGDPPRVMRLSRKAIGIASACGFALVGGALIFALQPGGRKGAEELYNTDGVAVADNLAGAPKDYGQVPKLGPPLPGDLGKPILDAQRRGDVAALPPIGVQPPAAPVDPGSHGRRCRPSARRTGTRSRARQPTVLRWRVAGKWKWWTGRASGTCGSYGCNARGCAAGGCRTQTAISGKGQRPAHRLG